MAVLRPRLTAEEVAQQLRLSRWSVYRMAASGALPATRLTPRGRLLFDVETIESVLAQRPAARPTPNNPISES